MVLGSDLSFKTIEPYLESLMANGYITTDEGNAKICDHRQRKAALGYDQ